MLLERHAFPGMLAVLAGGPDARHRAALCGGLAGLGLGVPAATAGAAAAGRPVELPGPPRVVGVRLAGRLAGWAGPRDVVRAVGLQLAAAADGEGGGGGGGGPGAPSAGGSLVLEFFGPGVDGLSCAGMAAICAAAGAEGWGDGAAAAGPVAGAVFPYTERMHAWLAAGGRAGVAEAAAAMAELGHLAADPGCAYERVVDVDLAELRPHVYGPAGSGRAWPLSAFAGAVQEHGWPRALEAGLIGSCTDASYEDLRRAAAVARQAVGAGITARVPFTVTPGSEQVRATLAREGLAAVFEEAGATVLAQACGPCLGEWRGGGKAGEARAMISSYNRHFFAQAAPGHGGEGDGGGGGGGEGPPAFVASPELVAAFTLAGDLTFDPQEDALIGADNTELILEPPSGEELPERGFARGADLYRAPEAGAAA